VAPVTFLLAHLSDPHIGPMPRPRRQELLGKRVTGYLNWTRARSYVHDMGALAQIVADIRAHHPDHIAMTGDISNIGLPAEFQLAHGWLETLGPAEDVSFVPGNHDAYVRGSMPDLARVFAPWTKGEKPALETYPYLRVRENVALIGLSSGVPTPFFIASGRLGQRQLSNCESLLVETGKRGLVRVVMIHHPPLTRPSNVARGLADARDFEAMLKRTGAELVIHGHEHRLSVTHLKGNGRPVPVVGVASASMKRGLAQHRASYNLYEFSGSGRDCKIEARARGLLPGTSVVGDLGSIDLHAG
jgi:3',5'-cyclic AMP phosphodiesterase CpdA